MRKKLGFPVAAVALAAACSPGELIDPNAADGIVFLTQSTPATVVMEALFDGRVSLGGNGCVLLTGGQPATVIWPHGFSVVVRHGVTLIRDERGHDIGAVGGSFRFGGGFVDSLHNGIALSAADRERAAHCPSPYWIVGDVPD